MSRIGIDCRLWGIKHSGIGRYTEELVVNLIKAETKNDYVLFCRKKDYGLLPSGKNVTRVVADIPHYGFAEQLKLPGIFAKQKLDLLHVPHFNVPVLYTGKFIATIHDLLWHEEKSWRATTLSAPKHAVKYLAYRGSVRNTVQRAEKIIVPTNTVKNDIVKRFKIPEDKVVVTYEGVALKNSKFKMTWHLKDAKNSILLKKYKINTPYLLYVGNLYPHKNVEILVHAVKLLESQNLQLVIVSSRNAFLERFQELVKKDAGEKVILTGRVPDEDLSVFYKTAEAFVFPSLSEGFGLPGLEAMANALPLLASDIPVFHEVYGNAPIYFDPTNPASLVSALNKFFKNENLKRKMVLEGKKQAAKYSWKKMAEETLRVYTSVV